MGASASASWSSKTGRIWGCRFPRDPLCSVGPGPAAKRDCWLDPMKMLLALSVCLLVAAPGPASGQTLLPVPVSLEARLGVGIPTGSFADEEPGVKAEPGPMLGAGAVVHLTRALALVGGYDRISFGCSRCGQQGLEDRVVDEGADVALQLMLPLRVGSAEPWVRLGGLYRQLSFSAGEEQLSSESAAGFQAGAGVSFALLRRIRVGPALHYRSYSAELDLGGLPSETVDVSHILLDVGLSYRF